MDFGLRLIIVHLKYFSTKWNIFLGSLLQSPTTEVLNI